jgi:hypothetical protein
MFAIWMCNTCTDSVNISLTFEDMIIFVYTFETLALKENVMTKGFGSETVLIRNWKK